MPYVVLLVRRLPVLGHLVRVPLRVAPPDDRVSVDPVDFRRLVVLPSSLLLPLLEPFLHLAERVPPQLGQVVVPLQVHRRERPLLPPWVVPRGRLVYWVVKEAGTPPSQLLYCMLLDYPPVVVVLAVRVWTVVQLVEQVP